MDEISSVPESGISQHRNFLLTQLKRCCKIPHSSAPFFRPIIQTCINRSVHNNQAYPDLHVYAGTFIQSVLQVGGSCLRNPTGSSTCHAGDLNPGLPHGRWQSYHYTISDYQFVLMLREMLVRLC